MKAVDNVLRIRKMQRRLLAVSLFLVAILAGSSSVLNPLFEPPDELQHYQFVRHLVDERELPVQDPEGEVSQSHQPPLYYLGGALLVSGIADPQTMPERNPFWAYYAAGEVSQDNKLQFLDSPVFDFPYQGTALVMHVLRLWSVFLALGTVAAVWLLGQLLWPHEPLKVGLMLALAILNPMFLYIAGAVNNDNMVALWGAVLLWLTAAAVRRQFTWRLTILIALVWAAALLSKLTGLFLVVPWGIGLAWVAWQKRSARFLASRLLLIGVIPAGLAGWWYIRNLRIYGDPLALQVVLDVWGARAAERKTLEFIWPDIIYSWTNFWGRFGYGQVPLPATIYFFFLALSALSLAGGIRWLLRQKRREPVRWPVWMALAATSLVYTAALLYYIIRNPTGANGRYLFPALPAIAALMTAALSVWLASMQRPPQAYAALTAIIAAISVYITAGFLPWVYARPPLLTHSQASANVQRPANAVFGQSIALLGTSAPRQAAAGETLEFSACWQAKEHMDTNFTLFVRLLDNEFNSLGQRDTYPGLGRFPTSYWQPGDIFCDNYPIQISDNLSLPVAADIDVGFYDLETGLLLPAMVQSGEPIDHVVVDRLKVVPVTTPAQPLMADSMDAAFEQGVTLIGYDWSAKEARGSEAVTIELAWQAQGALDHSYTIFAQLFDARGQLLAQDDGLPRDGAYPTDFWGEGETIVDSRRFTLPSDTAAGLTTLHVGFYLLEDLSRLPRVPGADHADRVEIPGPMITADR